MLRGQVLLLAREGEWGSGTQWGLGLVAHSPKLSAYLGGARLLQLPLLFVAAHAASFPGWPADAGG